MFWINFLMWVSFWNKKMLFLFYTYLLDVDIIGTRYYIRHNIGGIEQPLFCNGHFMEAEINNLNM